MPTNKLDSIASPPTSPRPPPDPPRPPLLSNYDVFLSFRGEDVRGRFIDHLYSKLRDLKIKAFLDSKALARGEVIEKSILTAIARSRISLVVFSSRYADSEWCLDELVKIMRCVKKKEQVVMPVFFHVSPDHVADQSGVYEEAFVDHESRFKKKRAENWRKAMVAVAGISGWRLSTKGSEARLVKRISKRIKLKLQESADDITFPADVAGGDPKPTLARSPTLKEVSLFSYQDLESIAIVRICGLGGLESTKSAKLVYDNIVGYHKNDRTFRCEPTRSDQEEDPELKWSRKIWDQDGGDISAVRTKHVGGGDKKKVLALVGDVERLEVILHFAAVLGWFGSGSQVVLAAVDVAKNVLNVVHIYTEGPSPPPGDDGSLDVACFMKEMVNVDELMNRVVKSLARGGLPAEIGLTFRTPTFENVGMAENGKLEIIVTTTRRENHQRDITVFSETEDLSEDISSGDLIKGGETEGGRSSISDIPTTVPDDQKTISQKSQRTKQSRSIMKVPFLICSHLYMFFVGCFNLSTYPPSSTTTLTNY